ncbi:hypothetical protein [Kibdelosporangium aridum]|uniref:hypothetical protein n=1 Tax=Kibdelosporangium aridum TaxID=2030 RepID=UPI0035EFCB20
MDFAPEGRPLSKLENTGPESSPQTSRYHTALVPATSALPTLNSWLPSQVSVWAIGVPQNKVMLS